MHDKINTVSKGTAYNNLALGEISNVIDPFSSTKGYKKISSLSLKTNNYPDEQTVKNNTSTQPNITSRPKEIYDHNSQMLDGLSIDFQVRWADGNEGNNEDSISPIASNISRRRIKRSSRNLLKKKSNSFMCEINDSKENDENLIRYIEYAKNLLGITPTQCIKDTIMTEDTDLKNRIGKNTDFKNGTDSGIGGSSASDDDLFDDSVDELMIQCSQAVEDSLDLLGKKKGLKHFVTPENKSLSKKRQKCETVTSDESPKENKQDEPQGHIKSLLDDSIELFDSMDFAYIDSLSATNIVNKLNENKITEEIKATYSQKEMIEKRKNEARRKLLFKMKSM